MAYLRRYAVVVSVALLSGSSTAAAQSGDRIYIIADAVDPELDIVAARAGSAARGALRAIADASWQEADRRFLGYDERTAEVLIQARALLEEGRAAYLDLQLDRAIELLTRCVENFDNALSAVEDPTDLGQALLYLGASQEFSGQSRAARRTFERMQVQMPQIQPDPDVFPPQVIERYQQSAAQPGDGVVAISSDPPGATAYIDFIPQGVTPITVGQLSRGEHLIRVAQPGATPYLEPVNLRRNAEVNAFLMEAEGNEGLAAAVSGVTGQQLESATGPLQEVATMLGLDKVGVIRASFGDSQATVKLEFAIFDVASGRRLFRGELQADRGVGQLESAVRTAVTAAVDNVLHPVRAAADDERPIVEEGEPIDTTPPATTDDGSVTGKWWFWASIGGGVVVVAAVVAIVVATSGDELGTNQGANVVVEFGRR